MGLRSDRRIRPSDKRKTAVAQRQLEYPFFAHLRACEEELFQFLDEFEQEKNENDGEDEADATASVVAESWSHAITTEAEHKDQDDQK